jgi:hypothetical protein
MSDPVHDYLAEIGRRGGAAGRGPAKARPTAQAGGRAGGAAKVAKGFAVAGQPGAAARKRAIGGHIAMTWETWCARVMRPEYTLGVTGPSETRVSGDWDLDPDAVYTVRERGGALIMYPEWSRDLAVAVAARPEAAAISERLASEAVRTIEEMEARLPTSRCRGGGLDRRQRELEAAGALIARRGTVRDARALWGLMSELADLAGVLETILSEED